MSKEVRFIAGPLDGETVAVRDETYRFGYVEVEVAPSHLFTRPCEDEHPTIEKRAFLYRLYEPLAGNDFAWGLPKDWEVEIIDSTDTQSDELLEYVPVSAVWDSVQRRLERYAAQEGLEILSATSVRVVDTNPRVRQTRHRLTTYSWRAA